ncbi:MAG: LPS biosynthesis protein WbpP [Bdellovibrionaceae bacterium]|nr:LPS biosynthesis protein WbpP [Pseudobdellovibrionaceae bacterium]
MFEYLKKEQKHWLVTGCAGFIASHLVENLLLENQKVTGLDNFSTGHKKNIDSIIKNVGPELAKNFTFIEGDLCNETDCKNATNNVEIILHNAALGSVPRSIKEPKLYRENNIDGFENLIRTASENGVKRFIHASSSSVYGDEPSLPKIENKVGQLLSPYAASKKINEIFGWIYHHNYQMEVIGLRYFNVFGPRQDPNGAYAAVIPKWINLIANNKEATVYGDGENSRDFCFIQNVCDANFKAAITQNKEAFGKVFNIACGDRTTLNELFNMISNEIKKEKPEIIIPPLKNKDFRDGDILHSLADISLANELLEYIPIVRVEEGLEKTVKWFLDHLN